MRLRKGTQVRITKHRNKAVQGMVGKVTELVRPSGIIPNEPGAVWVSLPGASLEAYCSRDNVEVVR